MNKQLNSSYSARGQFFLAYRDSEHEHSGQAYYKHLARTAGAETPLILKWKFEMFAVSEMRRLAVADACLSEVLLVSTREGEPLCPHVKTFLAECRMRTPIGLKLVVVLLSGDPEFCDVRCPDHAFLEHAAEFFGAALVIHSTDLPNETHFTRLAAMLEPDRRIEEPRSDIIHVPSAIEQMSGVGV